MNKGTLSFVAVLVLLLLRAILKLRTSIERTAPEGYEDEGGFHFGVPVLHE